MRKLMTVLLVALSFAATAQSIGGGSSSYSGHSKNKADKDYGDIKGFVLRLGASLGVGGANHMYGIPVHNSYGVEAGYRYHRSEFGLALDFMLMYPKKQTRSLTDFYEMRTGLSTPIYTYWRFHFLKRKVTPFITLGLGGCVSAKQLSHYFRETKYGDYSEEYHYNSRIMGIYSIIGGGCSFMNIYNVELQFVLSSCYWDLSDSYQSYYISIYNNSDSHYYNDSGKDIYSSFNLRFSVNLIELGKTLSSKKRR